MKKIAFAAAAGLLTLGLLAQAPAKPEKTPNTPAKAQTQTQACPGTAKPAAHKEHHKHTKGTETPAAAPAPAK